MEQNNFYPPVNPIEPPPPINPYAPIPKKPMERFALTKGDRVFSIILMVFSCLVSIFGVFGSFNGGYTVCSVLLYIAESVYLYKKGAKKGFTAFLYGLLGISLSLCFMITSNSTVNFVSFSLLFLLNIVWFRAVSQEEKSSSDTSLILNAFAYFFKGFTINLPKSFVSIFAVEKAKRKTVIGVLIGLAIALPALLIVVPLLMSSDEAFRGLIVSIFGNFFSSIFKTIFGLILGAFLVSYCLTLKKEKSRDIVNYNFQGIFNAPIITFLAVLSSCYFLYLFSQLAYFFSAFGGFLPADYKFTVAEYARRGFAEMAIIAALNFAFILTVFIIAKKKNGKLCVAIKILCAFISLFTLVIIATALSKMVLYINSFGMTILRVGTSSFMVFLAIVFICILFKTFIPKVKLLKTILVTAGIIVTLLGTLNINRVVAEYNYHAYNNGWIEEMDIDTLYELGDEGIPYIVKLADEGNQIVKSAAKECLVDELKYGDYYSIDYSKQSENYDYEYDGYYDYIYFIKENEPDGIGNYNIASAKAKTALRQFVEAHRTELDMIYNVVIE